MKPEVEEMVDLLRRCFPDSWINYFNDFIAHRGANRHYGAACCKLGQCETEEDVIAAALEMLTIDCCKSAPFETPEANRNFRRYMLKGMNKLLGKAFTEKQYLGIYTCIGNGINHQLTIDFIRSGYDLKVLWDSRTERFISMDKLLADLNKLEYRARSYDQMRGGNDVLRRLLPKLIAEQPVVEIHKNSKGGGSG
ncbi:MAG: hypothetical protein IKY18_04185 [Oscillospiraceae bacterium]|nr:hypothetical protein [Oscillospiraceae bacterium]